VSDLVQVYYSNALNLLNSSVPAQPGVKGEKAPRRLDRQIDRAYRMLARYQLKAGLEDFLANPFVRTALSILRKFSSSNYRIEQAIKLLEEAGEEAKKSASDKTRKSLDKASRGRR
jgi:hypothetical protein